MARSAARVVFVDVGAGDGVEIRVGDAVVLSDIGEFNIPFVYQAPDNALAQIGSREIEAIILSHAHDDHVKNLELLLESHQYRVKRALLSRNDHWSETQTNRDVMSAIRRHRVPITYVRAGQVFRFGGATWTILNPVGCINSVPRRWARLSSVGSVARSVHLEEPFFVLVALLPRAPASSAARGAALPFG